MMDDATERSHDGEQAITDASQDKRIRGLTDRVEWRERLTLAVAIAGVTIAGAGVWVSHSQWTVMNEQLKDSRAATDDMRRLIVANENQAKGIIEQATANRRIVEFYERSHLRASLFIDPLVFLESNPSIEGQTWSVSIGIENLGARPATEVTAQVAAQYVPAPLTPQYEQRKTVLQGGTAGPLETPRTPPVEFVNIRTGRPIGPITSSLLQHLRTGKATLIVHGQISYRDAVGCHQLEFCQRFDPTIRTGTGRDPTGAMMPCADRNFERPCE